MSAAETVQAWNDAINQRDRARFLELSHPDITLNSEAGVGIGHDVAGGWFDANLMRITVESLSEEGSKVLVEHYVAWLRPNGAADSEIDNVAVLRVRDDKVASYARLEKARKPVSSTPSL